MEPMRDEEGYGGSLTYQFANHHIVESISSITAHYEVSAVMEEMLFDIELWHWANEKSKLQATLEQANREIEDHKKLVKVLCEKEAHAKQKLADQAVLAGDLKERFVHELLLVKEELEAKEKLEQENQELGAQASRANTLERELARTEKQLRQMIKNPVRSQPQPHITGVEEGSISSTQQDLNFISENPQVPEQKSAIMKITKFEDKLMLKIFSFLPAQGVLCAASVDKRFYKRIDVLFGMGSQVQLSDSEPESLPEAPTSKPEHRYNASSPNGGAGPPQPPILNNAMATSIAKKLNSTELKGIISLQTRVKKLDELVGVLALEKEDIQARLQGTESVKDFLLGQLKDTEGDLKKALAAAEDAKRQHGSDQEVIGFLDNRVQELEKLLSGCQQELIESQKELEEERKIKKEKVRVIEEMINFEKQKSEQQEVQFKKEKRLLVTEVKKLRTQEVVLKAERDNFKLQLKELQESVSRLHR